MNTDLKLKRFPKVSTLCAYMSESVMISGQLFDHNNLDKIHT